MSTNDKDITAETEHAPDSPEVTETSEATESTPEAEATAQEEVPMVEAARLREAEAQIADLKDKYLRMVSEFENFRRRTAKEKIELQQTAAESLMVALLPTLDDFERALKTMETASDVTAVKEGVDLVYKKFHQTLTKGGLKLMPAVGQPFDSDIHEAIAQVPMGEDKSNQIIEVVENGYYLHEKPIRVAKVVIGA